MRSETLEQHQALPGAAHNLRLLYTSTDGIDGATPLVVSGALFLPPGQPPAGGWPLLLWSHGTVGIADICAPSWTGYVPFHQQHLRSWLESGYAIVASDYQGLGTPGPHPYMATRPEAYSNLDVIRAVQSADFPLSKSVVIAGQSQGAGAAVATAGYARDYAPDIDLRAVVATGMPYFSQQAVIALRKARPRDVIDPKLGYTFLILTLLETIDPTFDAADYVQPQVLPVARSVAGVCNRDMRARIGKLGLTYNDAFKPAPELKVEKAYAHMGLPRLDLNVPVFVGTGLDDVDTPPRMQAHFVKQACAAGTRVTAFAYKGFDHLSVLNHSLQDSMPFVKRALSGDNVVGNCGALSLSEPES
ncbi:MAG: lipase family protein [Pseudomonadales bacterium]